MPRRSQKRIADGGYDLVTGGTDNHLLLVDLRAKRLTGKAAEAALGRAHITCNKNGVPFDPEKPLITSGIRLGSPAATSRGFGAAEFGLVGTWIRRNARWPRQPWRSRQCRARSERPGAGRRSHAALPDLCLKSSAGIEVLDLAWSN